MSLTDVVVVAVAAAGFAYSPRVVCTMVVAGLALYKVSASMSRVKICDKH